MFDFISSNPTVILTVIAVFTSLLAFLFLNNKDKSKRTNSEEFSILIREIADVREELHKTNISNLNIESEKQAIVIELHERIKREASEKILHDLMESNAIRESYLRIIRHMHSTIESIERDMLRQNIKSNFNLTLGLMFALFGMIVIFYFINPSSFSFNISAKEYEVNINHQDYSIIRFLVEYLPKISIIIIIETFAYFFLRLYKSSLDYIKYLRNELTSIQHRFLAVEMSLFLHQGDSFMESMVSCISKLIDFEKNVSEMKFKDFEGKLSIELLSQLLSIINKDNSKK